MPVVSALRATRRGGVALHVDGEFLCTVSETLVAAWRLHTGRELSDDDVAEILDSASADRARNDAYRLLGHRARSVEELRRRLLEKGHDDHVVVRLLESLTGDGLLDDAAFARSYVNDKRSLGGWGSERIRRGLLGLGVDAAIAEAALSASDGAPEDDTGRAEVAASSGPDAAGPDEAELDRALALLERKGAPRPPLQTARRRAYQMLVRRGFSASIAYAAVRRWSGGAPAAPN